MLSLSFNLYCFAWRGRLIKYLVAAGQCTEKINDFLPVKLNLNSHWTTQWALKQGLSRIKTIRSTILGQKLGFGFGLDLPYFCLNFCLGFYIHQIIWVFLENKNKNIYLAESTEYLSYRNDGLVWFKNYIII